LAVRGDVVPGKSAFAFGGATAAAGDQPRQAAVGGPIRRPQDYGRGIHGRDFRADDQLQSPLLCRSVGPHDPRQAVPIGHGQGVAAEFRGVLDQLLGVRGAFEEREVRFGVKLGVRHLSPILGARY
jgi:hypothetical protein